MKKFLMLMMLLTLAFALAACGSSEEPAVDNSAAETTTETDQAGTETSDATNGDAASTVNIEASNWAFDQEEYKTTAGTVTINLNSAEGNHGIMVLGTDVKIDGEGQATVELEPGEYNIICSIPCGTGHADMTAKLIVE